MAAVGGDIAAAWAWAELLDHHLDAVARWQAIGIDGPEALREAIRTAGAPVADVVADEVEAADVPAEPAAGPVATGAGVAVERLEVLVAAGLPSATTAVKWLRSVAQTEATAWIEAGLTEPTLALAWRTKRFAPDEFARWQPVVDQPGVARAWRRVVGQPDAVLAWRHAGIDEPQSVARLLRLGVPVEEAAGWGRLGVTAVDSIVVWRDRWSLPTASQWSRILECDLGRAWWWHRVANGDLDAATRWHRAEQAAAPAEA